MGCGEQVQGLAGQRQGVLLSKRGQIQADLDDFLEELACTLWIITDQVAAAQDINECLLVKADQVVDVGQVSDQADQFEDE